MLNVQKVKGRMRELGLTQADVARAWGCAQATANQKLNRIRPLDLDEANTLADLLKLNGGGEYHEYFFAS